MEAYKLLLQLKLALIKLYKAEKIPADIKLIIDRNIRSIEKALEKLTSFLL